ncbi:MAG: glycosyltransferase, partial [Actinomycetota bacterium]|nr:glycosyltransferase [Actinomycetota bacterium]
VEAQTQPASQVVLVIDHNDVLLERARGRWPNHTVVANEHGNGLSGARNTGVARASAEVVAFLDDDAAAQPTWLERLVRHFDQPGVGGVGGLVRPAWVTEPPAWFPPEFLWVVGCSYTGLPKTVAQVRNPIGASMAFGRQLIVEAGGFDEGVGRVGTLPAGCEETELSIRLSRMGYRVVYEPDAVVDHVVPADRVRLSYFTRRCLAEGRSKAAVSRMAGTSRALESERAYVRKTLPAGVAEALRQGARGPSRRASVARAGAIGLGLGLTAWGYLSARVR